MFLKEFFYFNKSDRRVILFLLTIAVSALVAFFFLGGDEVSNAGYGYKSNSHRYDNNYSYRHYPHKYYYVAGQKAELFPFDPNTADSTELLRLGLRPCRFVTYINIAHMVARIALLLILRDCMDSPKSNFMKCSLTYV